MVFPLIVPLALGSGVFAGTYALQKLFSARVCEEKFDGSCDRECDYYTGDPETCFECLATCGVEEVDYPYYISKLEYYEKDVWADDDDDDDDDRGGGNRRRPRPRRGREREREREREEKPRDRPRPYAPAPVIDYRDSHERYKIGRRNRDKIKDKRPGDRTHLQDRLDKLTEKVSREHVGGGKADMTQDTRGMYGFIVA